MKKPELLSPAGDFERMEYAVAYGADAVYLAGKGFGMRTASDNFDGAELEKAIRFCHEKGVRVFVTVNTMPREDEICRLPAFLEELEQFGADAAIIADLGVVKLCKKYAPHVEIHISTQANIVNSEAAGIYYEMGAKRVVLARELSLEEIMQIRAHTPKELELETFVHGAMCMSYSGRCYISAHLTGRDANRGACAQPCRWKYSLVEASRPDETFPVYEDEQGSYLLNSKDLCMIDHIPQLMEAGIDSFKIEGRVKTAYYTAAVTNAYRRAIDLYCRDPQHYDLTPWVRQEVDKVSHREYYTGFYFGDRDSQHPQDAGYLRTWDICAMYTGEETAQGAVFQQKNKFAPGDMLELLTPQGPPRPIRLEAILDEEGHSMESAPHAHQRLILPGVFEVPPYSMLRKKRENERAAEGLL